LAREERNDLIGFTQAVGPEYDGFCFAQGHLGANVDAPTKEQT
jgi:hypothetical protein